ncbi:MAG TPA: hypothetical protein DCM05_15045 [Elusimicrobia bacterium]|nr:hypothetical protein [Elusimicrobiota bacterium]
MNALLLFAFLSIPVCAQSPLEETLLDLKAADTAPALGESRAVKPLILAIDGIAAVKIGSGLDWATIKRLWEKLFPNIPLDEKAVQKTLLELRGEPPARQADGYMERDVRAILERFGVEAEVEPILWNRDPDDSPAALKRVKARLLRARGERRPLYIVAHSWGSLLAYNALLELEREGTVVDVVKFVSMGSPIQPKTPWVRVVVHYKMWKEGLAKATVKPKGVSRWLNFYAERDLFSSVIPVASRNLRVDNHADSVQTRLEKLAAAGKEEAKKDLRSLNRLMDWHEAYHLGYSAVLNSLGKTWELDVPAEYRRSILP